MYNVTRDAELRFLNHRSACALYFFINNDATPAAKPTAAATPMPVAACFLIFFSASSSAASMAARCISLAIRNSGLALRMASQRACKIIDQNERIPDLRMTENGNTNTPEQETAVSHLHAPRHSLPIGTTPLLLRRRSLAGVHILASPIHLEW
jgi:hypothetical protein